MPILDQGHWLPKQLIGYPPATTWSYSRLDVTDPASSLSHSVCCNRLHKKRKRHFKSHPPKTLNSFLSYTGGQRNSRHWMIHRLISLPPPVRLGLKKIIN